MFLSLRIRDLFWVLLNVCGSLFLRGKGLVYTFTGLSPLWVVDWALGFFVSECYGVFGLWFVLERFVARVLQGGKVTIPKRLRELLNVEEGCYVRLDLVEVIEVKQKRGG